MVVINSRERLNYIYFIVKGHVSFYDAEDIDRKNSHIQMTEGSWFGDSNVLFDLKSNFSIMADHEFDLLHYFVKGYGV